MKRILLVPVFLFVSAVCAHAQDPVKVDPDHYKVEFENDKVRVLRVKIEPGRRAMHEHPDYVVVAITDTHVRHHLPSGTPEERHLKAGQTVWVPASKHAPEGLGDQPEEVIVIELKPPSKVGKPKS
jgi:quercetin dioxygenase-like cupin family protein